MIEFSETPVNKSEFLVVVVNHYVMWLNISVHDTLGVTVVESLKDLVYIESDIVVGEAFVEGSEINITSVNVLHDESRSLRHGISNDVDQIDDVDTTSQSLQDLDFSTNLGLLDGLQNFDNDSLVIQRVDTLVDLRVFTTANLLDDFIVFL